MEDGKLGIEQEGALMTMLSGRNVFLTGKAGTGKSTVIREFINRSERPVTLLAPTGTAALNVGGITIHQMFTFPPADAINHDMARLAAASNEKVLASIQTIIIDEISMVRNDLMTAMDIALRHVVSGDKQNLPFGGKQMIVVGDFCQLPPVISNPVVEDLSRYMSPGHYAFQSPAWYLAGFEHICLNHVYRQNDSRLLDIANAIRSGCAHMCMAQDVLDQEGISTPVSYIDFLNHSCHRPLESPVDPVCLCTRRLEAGMINHHLLSSLPDHGIAVAGEINGCFPNNALPTNQYLPIKHGARMMLLANKVNRDGSFEYTNGTIGTVTRYCGGASPEVFLALDNGREVKVVPDIWYNYDYELIQDGRGNAHFERREIGSFRQLPLAPSYAITIHKSQGTTLSGPVHIMLGSAPCFASGQLYTALTRCRNLDQITIDRPVTLLDCRMDDDVLSFHREQGIM